MYCLDYYTTNNNTFNNIVINNLAKLCNITFAYSFIQDYIFQTKLPFSFLRKPCLLCTTLILMDLNIIKVQPYNTRTTKVIINAQK